MRLTPFLAFRHLRTRLRSTLLTATGVGLGVMVMSTMASMLLGLQTQFIENVVENTPNITVEDTRVGARRREVAVPQPPGGIVGLSRRPPPARERGIANYSQVIHEIERIPGVVAAAPHVSGQVVLRYGTRGQSAQLTGVIPDMQARAVAWNTRLRDVRATLETRANGAIIGVELARNLGIPVEANVTLIAGPGRTRRLRVIALYSSGIRSVDESAVYTNLSLAQTLLEQPARATAIAIRVRDVNAAPEIAERVQALTGLESRSWQEVNETFFGVFRIQNTMTSLMIAFIVVIAGFGITNGLITTILEKQRDIGILKALGATAEQVVAIFLLEGLVMGIIGALIGMLLARLAIGYLNQLPLGGQGELSTSTTFTMLRVPGVYLIPAMISVVVSILASLLPVRRAAGYDPVEIIRSAK